MAYNETTIYPKEPMFKSITLDPKHIAALTICAIIYRFVENREDAKHDALMEKMYTDHYAAMREIDEKFYTSLIDKS